MQPSGLKNTVGFCLLLLPCQLLDAESKAQEGNPISLLLSPYGMCNLVL